MFAIDFIMRRMKQFVLICALFPLAACAAGAGGGGFGREPEPVTVTGPVERPEAEAVEASSDGTFVGFTVASLGDASIPGLWMETPLVSSEGPGRVISEAGEAVALTLRPSGGERGSGSRMSLAAYQTLGISLTDLPTVTVIEGSGSIAMADPA